MSSEDKYKYYRAILKRLNQYLKPLKLIGVENPYGELQWRNSVWIDPINTRGDELNAEPTKHAVAVIAQDTFGTYKPLPNSAVVLFNEVCRKNAQLASK